MGLRLAIDQPRVKCLAAIIDDAPRHVERCVEELVFLAEGGQRWTRTLQIQVPETPSQGGDANSTSPSAGRSWWALPLGSFRRRRFPDFTVTDAEGRRLNLLTRTQHADVLAPTLLSKYLLLLPEDAHSEPHDSPEHTAYSALYTATHAFTTVVGDTSAAIAATTLKECYATWLTTLSLPAEKAEQHAKAFSTEFRRHLDTTYYLCWVEAEPGEVVNLKVDYSVADARAPLRHLEQPVVTGKTPQRKALRRLVWKVPKRPRKVLSREAWNVFFTDTRHDRMALYQAYGLAPLWYAWAVPTAGSYYFTLAPPPNTKVTYSDWGIGNSFLDKGTELDSALHCAHLHHIDQRVQRMTAAAASPQQSQLAGNDVEANPEPTPGAKVYGYLRASYRDHKKIAGGALLNFVLIYLVATGRLHKVNSATQVWLLLTPAVLIAYIAEQQQHYYANVTRRQRGVLWWYLALSVLFLVTISFTSPLRNWDHWNWFIKVIASLLAAYSAGLIAWYAPMGRSFEQRTKKRASHEQERNRARLDCLDEAIPRMESAATIAQRYGIVRLVQAWSKWREKALVETTSLAAPEAQRQLYDDAVLGYCDRVVRAIIVAITVVLTLAVIFWSTNFFPGLQEKPSSAAGNSPPAAAAQPNNHTPPPVSD